MEEEDKEEVKITEIVERATNINNKVQTSDERFLKSIHLVFKDGATLFYPNAFIVRYARYVMWFTEHYGFGYSHEDEMVKVLEMS